MTTFVKASSADTENTHEVGAIKTSYARLAKLFGSPGQGDGYKVSAEWVLRDAQTGDVFTIYDWKATTLYGEEDYEGHPAPSPAALRRKPSVNWHIGGTKRPTALKRFIGAGTSTRPSSKATSKKKPVPKKARAKPSKRAQEAADALAWARQERARLKRNSEEDSLAFRAGRASRAVARGARSAYARVRCLGKKDEELRACIERLKKKAKKR